MRVGERLDVASRLEAYSMPEPNSGCWLWTHALNTRGYGKIWVGTKPQIASRVAYQTYVGHVPEGLFVCHKCDTPACVNPAHLFVGTPKDNSRDMIRKGRGYSPNGAKTHCAKGHPLTMSSWGRRECVPCRHVREFNAGKRKSLDGAA